MGVGFYDLLLVDINMPHMNGFELCEKILVIDINVRISFMSAVEINLKGLRDISITRHRVRYNQIIYRDRRNERARKNYQKNKSFAEKETFGGMIIKIGLKISDVKM